MLSHVEVELQTVEALIALGWLFAEEKRDSAAVPVAIEALGHGLGPDLNLRRKTSRAPGHHAGLAWHKCNPPLQSPMSRKKSLPLNRPPSSKCGRYGPKESRSGRSRRRHAGRRLLDLA